MDRNGISKVNGGIRYRRSAWLSFAIFSPVATVQTSGDLLAGAVADGSESYLSVSVGGRSTVVRPLKSEQLPSSIDDDTQRRRE